MAFTTVIVDGVSYSDDPSHPRSMVGTDGRGYKRWLFPMLTGLMNVAAGADEDASSAAASAIAAEGYEEDAMTAAVAAAVAKEQAEAAAAAAGTWDPANYPRKDSGQSVAIAATYTFSQPIYLQNNISMTGASAPRISLDTGDYFQYDKSSNAFRFYIADSQRFLINTGGTNVTAGDFYINNVVQPRITNVYSVAPGGSQALPGSPADLDQVQLVLSGDYTASAATITRNAKLINGLAEDLTIDNVDGFEVVTLQYSEAAGSWGVV